VELYSNWFILDPDNQTVMETKGESVGYDGESDTESDGSEVEGLIDDSDSCDEPGPSFYANIDQQRANAESASFFRDSDEKLRDGPHHPEGGRILGETEEPAPIVAELPDEEEIRLSAAQDDVARLLMTMDDTLFIGGPGTGKSYTLHHVLGQITGKLGPAACIVVAKSHSVVQHYQDSGGEAMTFASFVGAGGRDIAGSDNPGAIKLANIAFQRALDSHDTRKHKIGVKTRVVVIDEALMLPGDQFSMFYRWMRKKHPRVKIWLCGDVNQITDRVPVAGTAAFSNFLMTAKVAALQYNHRIAPDEVDLLALIEALRTGTLTTSRLKHMWDHVISRRRPPPNTMYLTAARVAVDYHVKETAKDGIELQQIRNVDLKSGKRSRLKDDFVRMGVGSHISITRPTVDEDGNPRRHGVTGVVRSIDRADCTGLGPSDPLAADNIRVGIQPDSGGAYFVIRGTPSVPNAVGVKSVNLNIMNTAAQTVHKYQGQTAEGNIGWNGKNAMEKGCVFTWASRARRLECLYSTNMTSERADELAPSEFSRTWDAKLQAMAKAHMAGFLRAERKRKRKRTSE